MTTTDVDTNRNDHEKHLRTSATLDSVFAYAYGYLTGLVDHHLQGITRIDSLRAQFSELTAEVSQAVERIMSTADLDEGGPAAFAEPAENGASRREPRTITSRFEDMET